LWCRTMHNDVLYPVHGKYTCARCLREWPVPWAASNADGHAALTPRRQPDVNSDVVVTAPEHGRLLIRLPIHSFHSTPAAGTLSRAQAGTQSR
jgi:hypothetical protein